MPKKSSHSVVLILILIIAVFIVAFSQSAQAETTPVYLAFILPFCSPWPTCTQVTSSASTVSSTSVALPAQPIHVADTTINLRVTFTDGSSRDFPSSQGVVFRLLGFIVTLQGKEVSSVQITIPTVTYDISGSVPKDAFGHPIPWWVTAQATVQLQVNGRTAYGPATFSAVNSCPAGTSVSGLYCNANIGNRISLTPNIPFNLLNWLQSQNFASGSYDFTIGVTETWSGYYALFGGAQGSSIYASKQFGQSSLDLTQDHTFQYAQSTGGIPPANLPATFSLSVKPTSLNLGQTGAGTSSSVLVTVLADQGFTGTVSLSLTNNPKGVSYIFNPQSASMVPLGTFGSTLTITSSLSSQQGSYTLTIIATSQSPPYSTSTQLLLTIGEGSTGICNTCLPENAQITLSADFTKVKPGTTIHLTGQLMTNAGIGFAGTVNLIPQWSNGSSQTVQVGQDGAFQASIMMPLAIGTYQILATFSGDATHSAASTSITITVSESGAGTGNGGNGGNGGTSGSCVILRIAGPTILGQQTPDIFKGIVLPDWLCAKTFGIPNWIIVAAIALLIVLWLLFGRRGSGGGGSTQNIYTGG